MAFELRWRPLQNWPEGWQAEPTKYTRERVPLVRAQTKLRDELFTMGVGAAYVETDHAQEDTSRLDGFPRAGTLPKTGRVQVMFELGTGFVVMRCNRFGVADWATNLHLIGQTLERQRLIRAYGCMTVKEQFGGFTALPPGQAGFASMATAADRLTLETAAMLLAKTAGRTEIGGKIIAQIVNDPNYRRQIYREAAIRVHPDSTGNRDKPMAELNAAKDLLDKERTP